MKLSAKDQAEYFSAARALSPMLGDPFQNPVDLTGEDIQREIDATYKLMAEQKLYPYEYIKLHNAYIWKLGNLIYFPEKFKP